MVFIQKIHIIYLIVILTYIILLNNIYKSYKFIYYNNKFIINIILIYILLTFNTLSVTFKILPHMYIYLTLIILLLFYNLNINKMMLNYILIINSILYCLEPSKNFVNTIILVELMNIILIFIILFNTKTQLNYKKYIYIILVSLNVITLSLFLITYSILLNYYKSTNIEILVYFLNNSNNTMITHCIYLTIFIKLGLITGPIFNQYIYNNFNNKTLNLYLYFYYIIFPFIMLQWLILIPLNKFIMLTILLLIIILNIIYIKNFKKINTLLYISGQINLIYIMLFII